MTRSTILAGSLAAIATVTMVSVLRTDAQDGPRPITANLAHYLEPLRQLYGHHRPSRWVLRSADTSAVVPIRGLEASARTFARIIDQANRLSRQELRK